MVSSEERNAGPGIRPTVAILFCLLVFLSSCRSEPELKVIAAKQLTDFPSASAIEYFKERIYIFGDDAPYLLVLDKNYNYSDTIRFVEDTAYRISKKTKPDIESAVIMSHEKDADLFALGSFSSRERGTLFTFPLSNPRNYSKQDLFAVIEKLSGRKEMNIEGLALTGNQMIMANRANKSQKQNQLILTPFWDNQYSFQFIDLDFNTKALIGISGLHYVEKRDVLFFTASTEETDNPMEDGSIGDSYLGWIGNFSSRQKNKVLSPDALINLTEKDARFKKQKIESLCMEEINGKELTLHLSADNDNGESTLFKVKLSL